MRAARAFEQPPMRFVTDDREALITQAASGVGVMRLGMFNPSLISSGRLVRLLPGWTLPPGPPPHAQCRRAPRLPARVVAFLGSVAEALADFDPQQQAFVRE